MKEVWGIAKITGVCKYCGGVTVREYKVNRGGVDWVNAGDEEPVVFGYMGDCRFCGTLLNGMVAWHCLIVMDEVEV